MGKPPSHGNHTKPPTTKHPTTKPPTTKPPSHGNHTTPPTTKPPTKPTKPPSKPTKPPSNGTTPTKPPSKPTTKPPANGTTPTKPPANGTTPTKPPVETDQNVTDTVEVKFTGAANNSNFPAEDFKKALAERLKTQPKRFHIASSTSKMLNQTDFHGEATITLDILHLKDEKKKVADVEKSLMALKDKPFGAKGDFMITSVE